MALLKGGVKQAKGGKREGSGRKTEDFRTELARLNKKHDILGGVIKMASGGMLVSEKVRLSASLWLLEMERGKPRQELEHTAEAGRFVVVCQ